MVIQSLGGNKQAGVGAARCGGMFTEYEEEKTGSALKAIAVMGLSYQRIYGLTAPI